MVINRYRLANFSLHCSLVCLNTIYETHFWYLYLPLKYYESNSYRPVKKLSSGVVSVCRAFAAFIPYFIFIIVNSNLDGYIEKRMKMNLCHSKIIAIHID